jgi:16S rRNA C967 or C1407 C5-methylase (RsmB/RsmF family)/NOL1/NOP2/fmu family ribosome biogenesis protein
VDIPQQLLDSLETIKGFDREDFERAHKFPEQITSIRINPARIPAPTDLSSYGKEIEQNIPWTQYGYYLRRRPSFTFDPLFHAGCYYVQEASSMFLEHALKQTVDLSKTIKILDLSAAPGGKSTHIQSLITANSLLVSNEVIKSRTNILKDNIIKWGCNNVVVTNNDPRDFNKLSDYFDVMVVDAPCSGSGLMRREPEAINQWSPHNVTLCCQRQQRILADALPSLKKNGILIYATCSYSQQEDEDIMDWLKENFKMENLRLKIDEAWGITETSSLSANHGYRFWPDKVQGEGFFLTCFRKVDGSDSYFVKSKSKAAALNTNENEIVKKWVKTDGLLFARNEDTVYAWPAKLAAEMDLMLSCLRVAYSGTKVGELVRDKLVPDHSLALSQIIADNVPYATVDYDQAIQYLQRKEIKNLKSNLGWHLVKYEGQSLGWINVLPGRINNYYPKELRILKESENV